jgi:hypothetical protein
VQRYRIRHAGGRCVCRRLGAIVTPGRPLPQAQDKQSQASVDCRLTSHRRKALAQRNAMDYHSYHLPYAG